MDLAAQSAPKAKQQRRQGTSSQSHGGQDGIDGDGDKRVTQKSQQALERKRAADRNTRRLERSRTKEHIATLEGRIEMLLRREDTSELLENLLEENRALNERIYSYQKQIISARLSLDGIQVDKIPQAQTARSESTSANTNHATAPKLDAISPTSNEIQGNSVSCPPTIDESYPNDETGENATGLFSFFAGPSLLGIPNPAWTTSPRTVYMTHHPSPLPRTSVYRLSGGLPNFHNHHQPPNADLSLLHTAEDVMADEKLDMFFGNLLPVFQPTLQNLYQGVSESISTLDPQSILDGLLSGPNQTSYPTPGPSLRTTDSIILLKMSLAKYAADTIREAQDNLGPEQRRSSNEIVAIFWIVCKLFTWMAFPTLKNYLQIPPWYRPTQAQLSIAHPSYIDSLVFPLLREKLVYTHETYETMGLLKDLNSLFTVVWEPKLWLICQDTPLISLSPENPWDFQLEPSFEAAIWDLRSWRMSPEFTSIYPELASCVHT